MAETHSYISSYKRHPSTLPTVGAPMLGSGPAAARIDAVLGGKRG